jgi:prepilin-type N-terminal cleavage/methylation domain-containing protein
MNENLASLPTRLLVTATFVLMVLVNGLANALPLNGRQTGEISDAYPNLFAPAGLTFAIWGLIYALLALHVLYQWGLFNQSGRHHSARLGKVGMLFSLSSLANTAWVFAWHYDLIGLSTLLIISILVLLALINRTLGAMSLTRRERWLVQVPFSIYFGWITVATVANITVWLVSIRWSGFGLTESLWALAIIAIAATIGAVTMLKNRDIAYGLVLIWAFIGILIKHTSATGFAGAYSTVIVTTIICLAVFIAAELFLVMRKRRISN